MKNKYLKDMKLLCNTYGIYDFNTKTKELSKVLKLYNNDNIYYSRFDYAYYKEEYRECTENDLKKLGHGYFLDNGSQPFKQNKS